MLYYHKSPLLSREKRKIIKNVFSAGEKGYFGGTGCASTQPDAGDDAYIDNTTPVCHSVNGTTVEKRQSRF